MEAHTLGLDTPGRIATARDEGLARLVGNGSERAFAALYHRYHQQVYRYCRSMLRDDADAQDALQSTFTSVFAALRERRRDAPLRPWLFRIAHNEAINIIRRRRSDGELPDELAANAGDTEATAERNDRLRRLVADLLELPERQRAALLMRELNGLSHEEIALALETTVGAAKQTIFEARRTLAEFEEGRMTSCDEICRKISNGDRRALRGRKVLAHLRGCASCAAFAAAIPGRSADLRALAPVLPPAATALLLSRTLGAGASGAGGGSGGGALGAGAAGKTAVAASGAKVAATVALAATATLGVGAALKPATHPAKPLQTHPAAVKATAIGVNAPAGPSGHRTSSTTANVQKAAAGSGSAAAGSGSAATRRPPASVQPHATRKAAGATRHQTSSHPPAASRATRPATRPAKTTHVAATPAAPSRGNSQAAPGHNKTTGARGNPHTSTTSTGIGNAGSAPGLSVSANAPGHTKLPGTPAQGLGNAHAPANGLANSPRNTP